VCSTWSTGLPHDDRVHRVRLAITAEGEGH
jgi:hypothetical protein